MQGSRRLTTNALRTFTGTEHWYRHPLARKHPLHRRRGYVVAVAAEEFQFWKLTVQADRTAILS